MKTIGFIGAGRMAQALASGIANSNPDIAFEIADPSDIACEQFCSLVESSCTIRETNSQLFRECDIIFLAVKPQYFESAIDQPKIAEAIGDKRPPLIVSIIAGLSIERIAQATALSRIVRVMPNTPCLVMEGASAIACAPDVDERDQVAVADLMRTVGIVELVNESLLDAVTGLSGSGPAYVFTFIESLIDGGVLMGLPRETATELATQTIIGAAKLMRDSKDHPGVLRDRVTSPGGTTAAGLQALETGNFRATVINAVAAAANRSCELGSQK